MSPSIEGPGSGASGRPPGSRSSIGKLITSVGPGRSIQRIWRSAISAVSKSTIDSSAAGFTFILRMTNRATLISSSSDTSMPDSLDTSMLTRSPSRSCTRCAPLGPVYQRGLLGPGVGVDDVRNQPMPDDVGAGELAEVDVIDAVENAHRRAQARRRSAGQVDLCNVARHNDFRVETESRQEHLHLLAGGVLRLV